MYSVVELDFFRFCNLLMANSFFDFFAKFLSATNSWIVIGLFVLLFILKSKGWKAILWLFPLAAIVYSSDYASSKYFKRSFHEHTRPCVMWKWVRHVDGCRGNRGFASSHAANASAIVTGFWLMRRKFFKTERKSILLVSVLFCLLVGWSRIYLGKHMPSQVVNGYLIGVIMTSVLVLLLLQIEKGFKKIKLNLC